MAKLNTSPLGSFSQAALTTINANMDAIEAAIENTLSRDGTSPNEMLADLDMNHNDVLNIGTLDVDNLTVDNLTAGQTNTDILYLAGVRVIPTGLDETLPTFPPISSAVKFKSVKVNSAGTGFKFLMNPFYDPYDYGALGNNSADDTAALVACQTAANANESAENGGIRGRGVIILPLGQFKTSGLTTQNPGEKWMGFGGTLAAFDQNQTVMIVNQNLCVIEDILFTSAFRPTTNHPIFKHSGGSDCTFRKLRINGGYYGIECGSGGGDSVWIDCKVTNAVGDFIYIHGYNGFWGIRNKFDGDWPANSAGRTYPTFAQIRGVWTPSTVVAVGDVMTANGYYHQCSQAGTTAGSGIGPLAVNKNSNPVEEFSDGTAKWKTHRTVNGTGVHINSDCFINIMWMTDITGGHIQSVWLENSSGTYAPQTVKFLDGCEFGVPLIFGMRADSADDVEIGSCVIDNIIDTSIGVGVTTLAVRGINIHDNMIRQLRRGIEITSGTTGASVYANHFGAITNWCVFFAADTQRFSAVLNMCGDTAWGTCAQGIQVQTGTSDEYLVALNRGYGISGTRWLDNGTGYVKTFAMNV